MNKHTCVKFVDLNKKVTEDMNSDIRVCIGSKRESSIEEKDGLTIFRVFFDDLNELKQANIFVTDCIIDGMSAREIFDLVKKKNFAIHTIEAVKKAKLKAKEQAEYKVRKFLGTYYFNYTK